ncbi:MAG: SusD/RagB family nutrient-binding outer membrane lipoprotein [Candidatus Azobacteroides sp.]|nr:SusD/RagB family nutrient-binding outer membrane lipoprotein [Candidatus Azobacteroides sp.]
MKRIYLYFILSVTALSFASCADHQYSDKYNDPSKTDIVYCDKLMTGVFYTGRVYTFNSYWRMYTWDNTVIGVYAQTLGFTNSAGTLYSANDSYANDRWINFYNTLTQFRLLQSIYDGLNESDQNTYRLFKDLAEVFIYDHLSQIIDTFGDAPFEKAGYLAIMGDVADSYPSYDKATDLYTMMLDRLGELYTDIHNLNTDLENLPLTFKALPKQDFINYGDLNKWEKYCNSLRLRLAVRVASQGDLSAKGKQVVAEILNGNYPLVSNLDETIKLDSNDQDTGAFFNPDDIRTGYIDQSRASQAMLDALTLLVSDENDPRLPIMYSKNAAGQYKGLSTRETYADQQVNTALPESQRVYSRIDSTTVMYNTQFISPILTAAEVDFLKAEAYQNGWASGDAKTAFVNGILHSAQFYFEENAISPSTYGTKMNIPADEVITAYAEKAWDAATNKEEAIITQKWLNFGFMQPVQAWNEVRRTGYPQLYFPDDPLAQLLKTLPSRVRYPASERSNNTANYNAQVQAMGGTDDPYIKLFWAK